MRDNILENALQVFLEYGYENASMRKIAARAGITPGAIYKHFSGKEEMFQVIFENCGQELLKLTDSMLCQNLQELSDKQLIQIFYSRMSVKTFETLESKFALYHILLNNDTGRYMNRLKEEYIGKCIGFLKEFYDELYKRGLAKKTLSLQTIRLLSLTEFSSICEIIMKNPMTEGITEEFKQAFMEEMNIILYGLEVELGIDRGLLKEE